jgi:hypothetical protein
MRSKMKENIPPTSTALIEALTLSEEILKNIELSQLPLENIALKVSRLARLLNDFTMQKIIAYEVSGYPSSPIGLDPQIYNLALIAGREYENKEGEKIEKYIYANSISQLENNLRVNEAALQVAHDPDISVNTQSYQHINTSGNATERHGRIVGIQVDTKRLSSRKMFIYEYTLKKHYELKFSGIADDIFTRIRLRVDNLLGELLPTSVNKLSAIYDNLQSSNTEDWSNAVHSCRRILKDLADAIFPPVKEFRKKNGKDIKLGQENYINRIIAFVEDKSTSSRFIEIVGTQLYFLGDRLDAIFEAASKGTHKDILDQKEADRYVVYTYLTVGDILTLLPEKYSQ